LEEKRGKTIHLRIKLELATKISQPASNTLVKGKGGLKGKRGQAIFTKQRWEGESIQRETTLALQQVKVEKNTIK